MFLGEESGEDERLAALTRAFCSGGNGFPEQFACGGSSFRFHERLACSRRPQGKKGETMASFPSRGLRGFLFGVQNGRRRKDRRRSGWSAANSPEQLEPRQVMAADSYDSALMAGYGYGASYDGASSAASWATWSYAEASCSMPMTAAMSASCDSWSMSSSESASGSAYDSYYSSMMYSSPDSYASSMISSSSDWYASSMMYSSPDSYYSSMMYSSPDSYASSMMYSSPDSYASSTMYSSSDWYSSSMMYSSADSYASSGMYASPTDYGSSWVPSDVASSVKAPMLPGMPTDLAGVPGDGRVRLTWTAPAADAGEAITDYVVEVSADAGATWATLDDGVSAATSTTLTGLETGTSYVFRVAAVNAVGTGTASAVSARLTPRSVASSSNVSGSGSGAGGSSGPAVAAAEPAASTAATASNATSPDEPAIGPPPATVATTSSADVAPSADPPAPVVFVPDPVVLVDASAQIAAPVVPDNSIVVAADAASVSLGSPDESAPVLPASDSVAQPPSTVQSDPFLPTVASDSTTGEESGPIFPVVDPGVILVSTGPEQAADPTLLPAAPPAPPTTTSLVGSLEDTAEPSAASTNGTETAGTTTTSDTASAAAGSAGGSNSSGAGDSSNGSVVTNTSPSETTGASAAANTGASGGTSANSATDGSSAAAGGGSSGAPSNNEGPMSRAGDSSGATGGSPDGDGSTSGGPTQADSASSDSIGDSSPDDDVVRITYRVNLVALENSAYFFDPKFACIKSQEEKDLISGLAADALKTLGPNAALGYGDSVQHILQDQWTFSFWSLKSVEVDLRSNFAAFDPGPPPPFHVPGRIGPGFPGFPEWKWCPDNQDRRGGKWRPVINPPGRSPPSTDFHTPKPGEEGVPHWDLNDGLGNHTYWDEQGKEIKQDVAKGDWKKDDAPPEPTPFSPLPFMPGAAPGSHQSPQSPSGSGASGFWPAVLRACFPTIMIIVTPPTFKLPSMNGYDGPDAA